MKTSILISVWQGSHEPRSTVNKQSSIAFLNAEIDKVANKRRLMVLANTNMHITNSVAPNTMEIHTVDL